MLPTFMDLMIKYMIHKVLCLNGFPLILTHFLVVLHPLEFSRLHLLLKRNKSTEQFQCTNQKVDMGFKIIIK